MFYPARTALHRKKPSRPAKSFADGFLRHAYSCGDSYLHEFATILDWGCGRGKDVDWLQEHLVADVRGYDPYFRPRVSYKNSRLKFDYITCFYVLNVIPTKKARIEVIKEAVSHMADGGLMFIAVRSAKKIEKDKGASWKKFRDGYKTSRDTFQHGFTDDELKKLVKAAGLCYAPWSKSGFIGCVVTKMRNE